MHDIRGRLRAGATGAGRGPRVVVFRKEGGLHGIAVDRVLGVIRLDPSQVSPPEGAQTAGGYLEGVGVDGVRRIMILDAGRILGMEKR